jgi:hypothetical protein
MQLVSSVSLLYFSSIFDLYFYYARLIFHIAGRCLELEHASNEDNADMSANRLKKQKAKQFMRIESVDRGSFSIASELLKEVCQMFYHISCNIFMSDKSCSLLIVIMHFRFIASAKEERLAYKTNRPYFSEAIS